MRDLEDRQGGLRELNLLDKRVRRLYGMGRIGTLKFKRINTKLDELRAIIYEDDNVNSETEEPSNIHQ